MAKHEVASLSRSDEKDLERESESRGRSRDEKNRPIRTPAITHRHELCFVYWISCRSMAYLNEWSDSKRYDARSSVGEEEDFKFKWFWGESFSRSELSQCWLETKWFHARNFKAALMNFDIRKYSANHRWVIKAMSRLWSLEHRKKINFPSDGSKVWQFSNPWLCFIGVFVRGWTLPLQDYYLHDGSAQQLCIHSFPWFFSATRL